MFTILDLMVVMFVFWHLAMVIYLMGLNKVIPIKIKPTLDKFIAIDLIAWFVSLFDFVMNFFKSYYDKEGDEILEIGKTSSHYFLSLHFFLDFASAAPIEFLGLCDIKLLPV